MQALEGIKVLDLSRYGPGHLCTMIMGDFGAEVLKIEAPPTGTSQIGMSPMGEGGEREAAYSSMNRNKQPTKSAPIVKRPSLYSTVWLLMKTLNQNSLRLRHNY